MVLEKVNSFMQKNEIRLDLFFYFFNFFLDWILHTHKNEVKYIQGFNIRHITIGVLKKFIGKMSLILIMAMIFRYDTKRISSKSKNQQVGLHQTKKQNKQPKKANYVMEENICNICIHTYIYIYIYIGWGLISKI